MGDGVELEDFPGWSVRQWSNRPVDHCGTPPGNRARQGPQAVPRAGGRTKEERLGLESLVLFLGPSFKYTLIIRVASIEHRPLRGGVGGWGGWRGGDVEGTTPFITL